MFRNILLSIPLIALVIAAIDILVVSACIAIPAAFPEWLPTLAVLVFTVSVAVAFVMILITVVVDAITPRIKSWRCVAVNKLAAAPRGYIYVDIESDGATHQVLMPV